MQQKLLCPPQAFTVVHDESTVWLWESGSVLGCCHGTTFGVALAKMHAPSKDDIWFWPVTTGLLHKLSCWICVTADGPSCAYAWVSSPFDKAHYITLTFHFMTPSILSITRQWPHTQLDWSERERFIPPLPLRVPFSLAYLAIKQLCFPPLIIYPHFFIKQPFQYTAEPRLFWNYTPARWGSSERKAYRFVTRIFWLCYISGKSNMKRRAHHIIKSSQDSNTNISCGSNM